jgi:hypothetical protein
VCTPVVEEETTRRSSPTVESVPVAKVWEATVLPFKEVIDPPAPPASVPQKNDPSAQRSFSVELLQEVRLAPKRVPRVTTPVDDALPRVTLPVKKDSPETLSADEDALVSEVLPDTERLPDEKRPVEVRIVVEAVERVVCPDTVRVDEKDPVVPTSAP